MLSSVPKLTQLNKRRSFLVLTKNMKKFKNFKFFDLSMEKLNDLFFSYVGFISLEDVLVFYDELFAVIKHLKKILPKKIKVISKIALVNAYTSKSSGVRMGKGKGAIKKYYAIIKKGTVFFEIFFYKGINICEFLFLKKSIYSKLSFKSKLKFLKY